MPSVKAFAGRQAMVATSPIGRAPLAFRRRARRVHKPRAAVDDPRSAIDYDQGWGRRRHA
jgi:hypothetical protein